MTLLDAPQYDARKARIRLRIVIGVLIAIPIIAFFTWYFWNWPEEHRVNRFFSALESKQYSDAYGIWNNDPNWQQHPDRYKTYPYKAFMQDWGPNGEYGVIHSAHVAVTKEYGTGVVVGVKINGSHKTLFLWVERKNKTLGFSPFELRY